MSNASVVIKVKVHFLLVPLIVNFPLVEVVLNYIESSISKDVTNNVAKNVTDNMTNNVAQKIISFINRTVVNSKETHYKKQNKEGKETVIYGVFEKTAVDFWKED